MITRQSKKMMTKSFKKTKYTYQQIPEVEFKNDFGIYVHVPFCLSKCKFCPFYKEIFTEKLKNKYLEALVSEITQTKLSGQPHWIYFGGGTPNTLKIEDLRKIIQTFKEKIELPKSMGIELLPSLVTRNYLKSLRDIGFSKVSVGVETLKTQVLNQNNRINSKEKQIREIISTASFFELFSNVDMMVGLPGQTGDGFLDDIKKVSSLNPTQVTIYPYMIIRDVKIKPSMIEREMFELIEKAGALLGNAGYKRVGIWTFTKGKSDEVYDSSRDELVLDYAGFGPAAFSTYGAWKVVNPNLERYLANYTKNLRRAYVAKKSKSTDDWRKFARMLYDLRCRPSKQVPTYMNMFIRFLTLLGYAKNGRLTRKGIFFTHAITKTVVESLPFPVEN